MDHQVVILAAGKSSRFFPFNTNHKSFFKLAGKTILERTLESVKKTNPSQIILVLGATDFETEKALCQANPVFDGVNFLSQENSLGQSDAILTAKDSINTDFFVINASQFNFDLLAEKFLTKHRESDNLATIGLTQTDKPDKYGIADLDGDRVRGVVEKPPKGTEPSNMRVVGVYCFSKDLLNILETIPPSDESLENALDKAAKDGKVGSVSLDSQLPSLKYPWDVLEIKNLLFPKQREIDSEAIIEETAVLKGDGIYIGKNAHVFDFAIIEGPAHIGENAVVGSYCQIRGGTILEDNAQSERYMDVKNSVIGEGTHLHSGFVGDSVIGKNCRIGAGFITANKRLDRRSVGVTVKGKKVDTGNINLGVFIGDDVKIGVNVSAMPGTVVAPDVKILPGSILKGLVRSQTP